MSWRRQTRDSPAMTLITSTTAYFALIFLLAGVVKGVVGLGLLALHLIYGAP